MDSLKKTKLLFNLNLVLSLIDDFLGYGTFSNNTEIWLLNWKINGNSKIGYKNIRK